MVEVTIQALLTCLVVNFKPIARLWEASCCPLKVQLCALGKIGSRETPSSRKNQKPPPSVRTHCHLLRRRRPEK